MAWSIRPGYGCGAPCHSHAFVWQATGRKRIFPPVHAGSFHHPARRAARRIDEAPPPETAIANLAAFGDLLRTPSQVNIHELKVMPVYFNLRGDPRFEALLNDPKNNAPLF